MKSELRKIYREKRKKLSAKEIAIRCDLILINFQKINLPFISCAHTYIASQKLGEVETLQLVKYLQFQNPGVKIIVPKIDIVSGSLEHFHFADNMEMIDSLFGIPEPVGGSKISAKEIDLVLIPLLAFDKRGYRVGYGKGYYDRFLTECREDIIKIGLSFFEAEEHISGINQFDIPLNYCITPERIYEY
ncbi:MAG: 5-formyltetrahydrofolate cyclo-ligase [Ginsengibacter sp.]